MCGPERRETPRHDVHIGNELIEISDIHTFRDINHAVIGRQHRACPSVVCAGDVKFGIKVLELGNPLLGGPAILVPGRINLVPVQICEICTERSSLVAASTREADLRRRRYARLVGRREST